MTKVYIATQVAALEVWGRLNWRMGILRNSRHQPRIFPKLTRSIFPSHSQANKWEYDIFMECEKFIYRLKHFHIWKIILFLPYYNVKQYELICYPSRSLSIFNGFIMYKWFIYRQSYHWLLYSEYTCTLIVICICNEIEFSIEKVSSRNQAISVIYHSQKWKFLTSSKQLGRWGLPSYLLSTKLIMSL